MAHDHVTACNFRRLTLSHGIPSAAGELHCTSRPRCRSNACARYVPASDLSRSQRSLSLHQLAQHGSGVLLVYGRCHWLHQRALLLESTASVSDQRSRPLGHVYFYMYICICTFHSGRLLCLICGSVLASAPSRRLGSSLQTSPVPHTLGACSCREEPQVTAR